MRLVAAFAVHEWRTQWRSLRFRVLALVYLLVGSAPAVLVYMRRLETNSVVGGATYASESLGMMPLLTAILALVIALDGMTREQDEGAWSTVGLAGMSSAGYLLRRWLAFQAVLVPLTVVPVLAATVAAVAGAGGISPGPLLGPWLMMVVPIAMVFSGLGLSLGTIAGGTLNAFLLGGVVLGLVPALINALLGYLQIRLGSPLEWVQIPSFASAVPRMVTAFQSGNPWWAYAFPIEMSESPYDLGVAAEQYLTLAAMPVALAAAAMGMAVRHLRRTRPDVRPLRVPPKHPLRTFLGSLARMRERFTPDPLPSRMDLLTLGLALLLATGSAAWIVARAHRYEALGETRFGVEKAGGPAPTPTDVLPGRWRVEGTLGSGRSVDLRVTGEMHNTGNEPRAHLAFTLNPFLRAETVEAGEGRVSFSQRWDRLAVDLGSPIPPGGSRELRFRLAGEPAAVDFALDLGASGFHKVFGNHFFAQFHRDLGALASSYRVPALSPRRIYLGAEDLTPVPRYQSWKLMQEGELTGDLRVPRESFLPQAEVTLALDVRTDAFLADTCGGTVRGGRLESRCRMPLAELAVAGGRYRRLPALAGGAAVAVYPQHAGQAELHVGFLARGTRKLAEAWPGVGGLGRTVVLEWPEESSFGLDADYQAYRRRLMYYDYRRPAVQVLGNLVLLREESLIRQEALNPDLLVAEIVASRLARRRPAVPEDAVLFQRLFRELALQGLGLGSESGATLGLRPGQEGIVHQPPPSEPWADLYWNVRFPALVAALRVRMGPESLRRAVDALLSRRADRPLTRQELYDFLAERSERPLGRMIPDFFVEGALPEPVLEGVQFRRAGAGWQITGRMLNRADGEADCKIVLTTDLGPLETYAKAGAGQAGAFAFSTARRPQAVLLDPNRECHRLVPPVPGGDRVFFEGGV